MAIIQNSECNQQQDESIITHAPNTQEAHVLARVAYFYYVLLRSNFVMWFGIASSLVASKYVYETEHSALSLAFIGVIYGVSYSCTWCTMNQYSGERQDRMNQRKRVLELKLIHKSNLRILSVLHSVGFILIGHYLLGLGISTTIVVAMFAWYNHLNGDRHWTTQLIISIIVMMIYVEMPHSFLTNNFNWKYSIILSLLTAFPNLIFADLKDTYGDRKVGRKTLPIILGDFQSKLVIITFVIATPFVCMLLIHPTNTLSFTCVLPMVYRLPLIIILLKTNDARIYGLLWVCFGFIWEAIFVTSMPFCCNVPNMV